MRSVAVAPRRTQDAVANLLVPADPYLLEILAVAPYLHVAVQRRTRQLVVIPLLFHAAWNTRSEFSASRVVLTVAIATLLVVRYSPQRLAEGTRAARTPMALICHQRVASVPAEEPDPSAIRRRHVHPAFPSCSRPVRTSRSSGQSRIGPRYPSLVNVISLAWPR
jgi:hypothetical protein